MTQLSIGVTALNRYSEFAAAYERGVKKTDYWSYVFDDCINLTAKLPALAARIYRNTYFPERQELAPIDTSIDLIGLVLLSSFCVPAS